MNISVDVLFQVITLFSTVIGVVWYISNVLSVLKSRIAKSDQLNALKLQVAKLEGKQNERG